VTGATVAGVEVGQGSDEAPPVGTAVVRPLRHVRAVRERYLQRFTGPEEIAASRSARAWAWALGECATSPVTDRRTSAPPNLEDIETEIAEADRRRLTGSRENRADAAATILRWIIGHDDHVPVGGPDKGSLVGGFGDVVRSRRYIAGVLALATAGQRSGGRTSMDTHDEAESQRFASNYAHYLQGVAATLAWVLGDCDETPISRAQGCELTTKVLKMERVHAEDLIDQAIHPWEVDDRPRPEYGEGVQRSIDWLLGDIHVPPTAPR